MKAALRDRYGPPEVVELREVETPTPAPDQVLVRVRAASVNRADLDYLIPRPSFSRLFIGLRAPNNPRSGIDVAGVVEAVGAEVTGLKPGDRVFADLYPYGHGAFAEFACARQKAFQRIPEGISFEDAATLPHSATLAIQGLTLRDGRTVGPGDRVVIDGAGGNVGPFAVQIAKARGAEVTAIDHTSKLDFLRSLGADHVLDYTTTDYTKTGERYDWILDTDSHHSLLAGRRALRPKGVYVTLGGTSWPIIAALALGPIVSRATGKRLGLLLWWKPFDAEDVATLTEMVLAGTLKPAIDRRYDLADIVDALRYADGGRPKGKIVISAGSGAPEAE